MNAHRLHCDPAAHFAGEQLRHSRLKVDALPCVFLARRLIGEQARRLYIGSHFSQFQLDRLMLRYGLPETFALLRVLDGGVECRRRHAHRARRHIDAPALKPAHHIAESAPLVAHKVLRGYANIVKHKLSGVYAAIAQFVQLLRHAETRRRLFHHKAAYAPMRRRRGLIGSGKHGKGVAARAVGYEHLVAVDDILFAVFDRRCLQVLHIAAAARLGQRQAAADRAFRHLGQKPPL